MKKLLLPTDFSENSWNAIKYALQLFKNEKCKIYILHTYTPVIYHAEYVLAEPVQLGMLDTYKDDVLEKLEALKTRINEEFPNPNHNIKTIGAFNMLIAEMIDIVTHKKIDYVVMGTQGATGAKEILFGSNTVHAFKNVKCPIIAIPNGFEFENPHDILFPTDYDIKYKSHHLKPIKTITSLYNTRLNILHLTYGYELSEKQQKNKSILEKSFKKTAHLFHEESNQTVEQGITYFQEKTRVNMLIMINNKHSFFENLFFKSTINQIGLHIKIPFLVIPSKHIKN